VTLTGVAWQTAKYLDGLPDHVPTALAAIARSLAPPADDDR
jgi:hypothetical protein